MKRLLSWMLMLPAAVVVVVFSLSNRAPLTLDLWPFAISLDVPVFALGLAGLVFGFFYGAFAAWLAAGPQRVRARALRVRAENAEREIEKIRAQQKKDREAEADRQAKMLPPVDAA